MKLKNCPRCGKLFADNGTSNICSVCLHEEEDDFQKVKNFLWDNPNSDIEVVHEKTGVERETIIKFVREDRLIAEGLAIDCDLECERCGTPISHGRFCKSCQEELIEGFSSEYDKKKKPSTGPKEKKTGEMYLARSLNKRK